MSSVERNREMKIGTTWIQIKRNRNTRTYPEFGQSGQRSRRELGDEVVEEAERAERVVDAGERGRVQALDEVAFQVDGRQAVEARQDAGRHVADVVVRQVQEGQLLKPTHRQRDRALACPLAASAETSNIEKGN